MFGKTGDDGDFKRSEYVGSKPPVWGVRQTFGCLGDRHKEIK
jgi:hypothetical protein